MLVVYILLYLFIEMTEKLLFMFDSVLISEIFHHRRLADFDAQQNNNICVDSLTQIACN